jgi:MoaA/NifB/PqqE/SkfB family radical SAM enzyme
MIKTSAIRNVNKSNISVVWDTGRRCNYDCTYCEATRHNNYSKPKPFEEFKNTFDFIREWESAYNSKRKNPRLSDISFTGGEPTANPNFWQLIDYIRSFPENRYLSLTTNGAWSKKYSKKIIENFGGVTVSYHAEADKSLKDSVIQNILELSKTNITLQVNVMLHVDHWEETVQVYNMLKQKGIVCNPRPIGDGGIVRKGWFIDSDGTNRRTSHEYSIEQQKWFWNEMGIAEIPLNAAEGNQLGRKCCANIPLEGKVDGQWRPIRLIDTHFKDWYCMVDWFFLYIDQETQDVYHHQTCKAFYENTTGPIGNLKDSGKMLDQLKNRLSLKEIPYIVCPNNRCGCGMCVPKSQSFEDFRLLQESIIV